MTLFLDAPTFSTLVRRVGLEAFFEGLMSYLEEDFKRWPSFDKNARTAAHSEVGVIELMPVADAELFAFKYVNGHPTNPSLGLPTVMAFGALSDVATGYPRLLCELTLATALRTAATSAMAAKALARKNARSMAIIGCGAQCEFQALAFHTLLGINEVRLFDIDARAVQKAAEHLKRFPELKIIQAQSAEDCVRAADIVTTATADKNWATILTPSMVEDGMHINALGGDCPGKTELHPKVLENAKIFVEHETQTRLEGEIQQLSKQHPVHPLWQVLAGSGSGRDDDAQLTLFDSVGFALEDFSVLRYIFDLATEQKLGEEISLIPNLNDPKDLFALCH